jgi:hypothetical protein
MFNIMEDLSTILNLIKSNSLLFEGVSLHSRIEVLEERAMKISYTRRGSHPLREGSTKLRGIWQNKSMISGLSAYIISFAIRGL